MEEDINEKEAEPPSVLANIAKNCVQEETKKKSVRRKLPPKGSEEYVKLRNQDAKRRRLERTEAHKCPHCEFAAPFPNKLRIHIKTNHSKGRFKCDKCCEVFDDQHSKRKHTKEEHPIVFSCGNCDYTALKKTAMKKHVESAHINGIKCTVAGCNIYLLKRQLKKHLVECHPIEERSATKTAKITKFMRVDIDNFNPGFENISFDEEEETASTSGELQRVPKSEEWESRGYSKCDEIVDNLVEDKSGKKNVLKKEPPRAKKHNCPIDNCSKSFTTVGLLEDHLNVHNNITPYWCNHCDQKFHARARFAVHLSKYHQMSIKAFYDVRRDLRL